MPERFVRTGDHRLDGGTGRDLLRSYMREIGRIPLLTPEEEITLGRRVQQLMALELLQEELTVRADGQAPSLSTLAATAQLSESALQQRQRAGRRAKERMISANLRLVVSIARNYTNSSVELADLIQEGTLGLVRAVEKFDPSRGYKFSTYAYWWIRQGITKAIAEKSRTIRLPGPIHDALQKLKRCHRDLSQALGRTPRLEELAEASGLSELDVREVMFRALQPLSFETRNASGEDFSLLEVLACEGVRPDELAVQQCLKSNIHQLLEQLPDLEAKLLRLRYGIGADEPMSLCAIAREFGMTRDRARGVERRALAELRRLSDTMADHLAA